MRNSLNLLHKSMDSRMCESNDIFFKNKKKRQPENGKKEREGE